MEKDITISKALFWGWESFKKHWQILVGMTLFVFAISAIVGFITGDGGSGVEGGTGSFLLNIFVHTFVGIGLITIGLEVYAEKTPVFKDFFLKMEYFLNYLIGMLLYGIIVIIGFFLLFFPGVIWALKYQFFGYLIVEKGMSPMDALRQSGKMTYGKKWFLLLFWIVLFFLNVLGAIVIGIGLLVTIPVSLLATMYIYKKLSKDTTNQEL